VAVDARVRLADVEIVDNHRNGIGFDRMEKVGGAPATVEIEDCLISGNQDGIDLESTRGVIRDSRLVGNRDDGIDYDGNTDCAALDNRIRDNGDDGIEIRLKRDTRARIEGNVISGNGEDGIEIIDTWQPKPTANRVEIADNVIRDNARYGIGAVEHASEDVRLGLRIAGIVLGENRVSGNGRAEIAGVDSLRATVLPDPAPPRGAGARPR
jgi:parallel beta-helix repeat protein